MTLAEHRSPPHRRWPYVFLLMVVVGFVIPLCIAFSTPWPGVHLIVRPLFNEKTPVTPRISTALQLVTISAPVRFAVDQAPPASLFFITPKAPPTRPRPVILWIHGGGYVAVSAEQMNGYLSVLASNGFTIANLEYSLAPENLYPVAMRQAVTALAVIREHAQDYGGDPTRLIIAGDSAGAQMASQLAAMITNEVLARRIGIPIPFPVRSLRGVMLHCGFYNMYTVREAHFAGMGLFLWSYIGQRRYLITEAADEMSTTRHATSAFPPAYINAADGDPLQSQAFELEAILRSKGVPVTTRYWTLSGRKLSHDYQYDVESEPGQSVLKDMIDFVRGTTS
jgi:acetyl esterase